MRAKGVSAPPAPISPKGGSSGITQQRALAATGRRSGFRKTSRDNGDPKMNRTRRISRPAFAG